MTRTEAPPIAPLRAAESLPLQGAQPQPPPSPEALQTDAAGGRLPVNLPNLLRTIEELYICAALQHAQGNRKAAADLLGLQRTTLVEKLRRRRRETESR